MISPETKQLADTANLFPGSKYISQNTQLQGEICESESPPFSLVGGRKLVDAPLKRGSFVEEFPDGCGIQFLYTFATSSFSTPRAA
jgi:hypothetical protein